MKVIAAGMGPGSAELMTDEVKRAIAESDIVLTSAERFAASVEAAGGKPQVMTVKEIIDFLAERSAQDITICVAASGDTGFYSIAAGLERSLHGTEAETVLLCGISSMSYMAARANISYEDAKLVSLHGREGSLIPYVSYNEKVFALTGGSCKAHSLIKELCDAGLSQVRLTVGENLSAESERIMTGTAAELQSETFEDLTVIFAENAAAVKPWEPLRDEDLIRGDVPMTKESIRNLSLSELGIEPKDTVYDIGAGTGSVACAMARRAYEGRVFAVEKNNEAAALIRENIKKLGAYNVQVIEGGAPDAVRELPPADKVFIGGSSGNLQEIMACVLEKNPQSRITVTAVTLETLTEAQRAMTEQGIEPGICCITAARAQKLGAYHLMKGENPVYILTGQRGEGQ